SRTKDLVPWMVRLVQEMPAAKMTLADLRRAASQDALFEDYRRWAGVLAQWSDWNSSFDTAFDQHLRLAMLGETKSRDRCVQLQNYLGRAEECCEMLVTLGETNDRPELALVTATLLAELGRDEEAKPRFEAWIKGHPKDREAHFDYACLLEDMGDETAARKAFAATLKAFPDDVPTMKRLAAACIRDADYPAALGIYAQMADKAHDPDTLENYAMIAESLDDHEAEFRALHLTTRLTDQPTTELYLDLAETAGYLPEAQVSIDALHEGLQRLPHSTQLRIALANHYLHAERPDEALAALASDNLRDNFEAAQFILGMSDAITDAVRALEMLGADVETRFQLGAENRLQLGVLHFKAGHQDQCDRLFASVKEERRLRKPLAEARYQIGDFGESVRLMTAYLKETQRPSPIEWVFSAMFTSSWEIWMKHARLTISHWRC
ncbi:MAG: tetratricopeptide repeat protein, partial [Roseimicrobium sp.]